MKTFILFTVVIFCLAPQHNTNKKKCNWIALSSFADFNVWCSFVHVIPFYRASLDLYSPRTSFIGF